MSTGVVVTHAHRTAVGKSGRGTLRETRPDELLGRLIETFMERVPDLDPGDLVCPDRARCGLLPGQKRVHLVPDRDLREPGHGAVSGQETSPAIG